MPSIATDKKSKIAMIRVDGNSSGPSTDFREMTDFSLNAQVTGIMQKILKNTSLQRGFWYPHQYHHKLQEKGSEACLERLNWLQKRGDFFHGYLSHSHFIHTHRADTGSPTEQITEFQIKESVLPSEAMDVIFSKIALVDCSNACQIAQYQTIRESIGDEKFNLLFQGRLIIGDYLNPLNPLRYFLTPCHDGNHPQAQLCRELGIPIKDSALGTRHLRDELDSIPVGASVLFTNVDRYTKKHPIGSSAGFNVIYAGEDKYYAFRISQTAISSSAIFEYLINSFNAPPTEAEHLDAKSKNWYESHRSRFLHHVEDQVEDFLSEGGGRAPFSGKMLNEKLIQAIIEMDIGDLSWEWVLTSCLSTCEGG